MDTTGEKGRKDGQSNRRKSLLLLLLGVPLAIGLILTGLFFLIQIPAVINLLGAVMEESLGYRVTVRNLSLSPQLRGEIEDLEVKTAGEDGLVLRVGRVALQGQVSKTLKGEIESIVLTGPKLFFRVDEKGGKGDLSFLKKLPTVRLLSVQNGEVELSRTGFPSTVKLKGLNLIIKEFSPRRGGAAAFESALEIISPTGEGLAGKGDCKGSLSLTSLFPVPAGKGSLELRIGSATHGAVTLRDLALTIPFDLSADALSLQAVSINLAGLAYAAEGNQFALSGVKVRSPVLYDLKSGVLTLGDIEGGADKIGGFRGSFAGTLKGDFPWKASVQTTSVDLGAVLGLMKSTLPPEYRGWGIQGKGLLEASLEGTYSHERLAGSGTLSLDVRQGGFNSPDSTKAGQGMTGKVILKIRIPSNDGKGDFALSSELGGGEILWGKFYKDLSGRKVGLLSEGSFSPDSPRLLEFKGTADLLETGRYSFSASLPGKEWRLSLSAEKVSHHQLLSVLLKDYLLENFPGLKGIDAGGTADVEVDTLRDGDRWQVRGMVSLNDTSLTVPEAVFSLTGMNLSLPFDLFYPPSATLPGPPVEGRAGRLTVRSLAKERLALEDLSIPLVLSHNAVLVPEDIKFKTAGGDVVLSGLKGEDILSGGRSFVLGLRIEDMDFGSLTEGLMDMSIPGRLDADFPAIIYKRGLWRAQGRVAARVFGGEVEATNLFAIDLLSPSRKLGGNLSFRDISLEKFTEKIEIGKISGVMQGSVRDLEMEYGQLSRFILDVESVKTRGVDQTVSVEAVQNLSILGTGSEGMGMVLGRGLGRFFKKYAYSRIGFTCTLENDVFTIRGKIHEGGTEYLIRRAFLRGIDVVNQNPQNRISFKDMQERIGRLFMPGETGGPEIR